MRRILTTGLLVSTILAMAVPATAQSRDGRERGASNGGQRQSQSVTPGRRDSAPARAPQEARRAPERAPSAVQTRPVPPSNPGGMAQRQPDHRPSAIPGANNPANPASPLYNGHRAQRPNPPAQQAQPPRNNSNAQRPDRPNRIPGANNPANPASPRYNANRDGRGPNWNNDNRRPNYGNQSRLQDRQRWANQQRWSNNWRSDRRYDWQDYRSRYRNIYRMPSYRPPYGWNRGYSRFSIGIVLNNILFDQSYWINDPYYYRLPPAYGSLRWIRYYDDALLVDIRDGYVVDVIHNFFW
jgi:hypothetical protein